MFQRSLNLLVKPNGEVKVTAGKTTLKRSIHSFLESQKSWLLKNLAIIENEKNQFPDINYKNGETILFIGKKIKLNFKETHLKRVHCKLSYEGLDVLIPNGSDVAASTKAIKSFYKKSGTEVLKKIIEEKSKEMHLFPKKLSFRSQKTRWGSCSSQGNISLNWKLVLCPPEVIEYVVIHELAHLKFQDHSKRFWNLVSQYSPEHKQHTNWLKKNNYQIEKYNL